MSHEEDSPELRAPEGYAPKLNEMAQKFIDDLQKERSRLTDDFPLCALLINEAFDQIYSTGRVPGRGFYADVLKQRPMKLTQKVFVPVKQYPNFNFTGKLLGPKANSLKRLQEETQCRITIKGRNSMRNRTKEEELRNTDDPRYNHLNKDLYVEIQTVATPAESYARVAYALAEIRKYLTPDKNDEVSHEQLQELMEIDPDQAKAGYGKREVYKTVFDKPGALKKTLSYISYLKQAAEQEQEQDDDEVEYEQPPKRPGIPRGFEYRKGKNIIRQEQDDEEVEYEQPPKRPGIPRGFEYRKGTTPRLNFAEAFLKQRAAEQEQEEQDDEVEYEQPPKRPGIPRGFEYRKAPATATAFKRTTFPTYAEHKRFREVAATKPSYATPKKPLNPYGIFKKYNESKPKY